MIMREEELISLLKEKGLHICCAESCTGGMLSSTLVNVVGASDALDMGFVTYANEAKIKLLGVDAKTIEHYGVVSEQVAEQMAHGAAEVSGAQVAVGISGIAGPGGSKYKPEGMVCFGFYINGKTATYTKQFGALGRQNVRTLSCEYAIDTLLRLLKDEKI